MNADEKRLWQIARRVNMGMNRSEMMRHWVLIKRALKSAISRRDTKRIAFMEIYAGRFLMVFGSYQGRFSIGAMIKYDKELADMGYVGFATNGTQYRGSLAAIFRTEKYDYSKLRMSFPNDKMGSLWVKDGYQATIFEHGGFKGRSQLITGSNRRITDYGIGVSAVVFELRNPELQKLKEQNSYQTSVINGLRKTVSSIDSDRRSAQQMAKDAQFQVDEANAQVKEEQKAHAETKGILNKTEEVLQLSEKESDQRAIAGAAAANPQPEMFSDFKSMGNTLTESTTTNTIALAALVIGLSVSFYTISKN